MTHALLRVLLGAAAAYAALVAHEAGHLLAGRLAGFRFGALCVGPLALVRRGRRFALRALPPWLWGPLGLTYPVSLDGVGPRFAWVIAGGPLASLAVALLALACTPLLSDSPGRVFLRWLALLSGGLFVGTAQPFGSGAGVPSDGGRAWRQLRGGEEARRDAAFVALARLAASGVRPRDWDSSLLEQVRAAEPPLQRLEAASLLLQHALDRGDADGARARAGDRRAAAAGAALGARRRGGGRGVVARAGRPRSGDGPGAAARSTRRAR